MKLSRKMPSIFLLTAFILLPLLSVYACAEQTGQDKPVSEIISAPLTFTIAHIGDTHTYVEPYDYMLKINGRDTIALMGGYSLLASAVDDLRSREKNVLLLHAGDILEGTIWTPAFGGLADCDCLNQMKFDALVLGNHDLARGATEAAAMVNRLKFPVLAANLNVDAEPTLKGKILPYRIVEIEKQKIGIIGLTTPDTAWMSQPGRNIEFLNLHYTARNVISLLNKEGVNKIIVLSHLGYDEDVKLARSVSGIDVIIGGHSHTFMGGPEFKLLGLSPQMQYPTELTGPSGERVLIAHAWEYNRLMGELKVNFDDKGRISSYTGQTRIYGTDQFKLLESWGWSHLCSCNAEYGRIMQTVRDSAAYSTFFERTEINAALQPYFSDLPKDAGTVIATADENLFRGVNKGPGPIIADAFLWGARKLNPAVQFAIYASYDIRNDIYKGDLTMEKISMLVPMRQKLATVTASGSMIRQLIEMVYDGHIKAGVPAPYLETSGLHMIMDLSRGSGERITSLKVRDKAGDYRDIQSEAEYTFVTADLQVESAAREVVSRLPLPAAARQRAAGWIINYLKLYNIGVKDVDTLADYCRMQKNLKNVTEERTTISPSADTKK